MSEQWSLTVDCAHPRELAEFWCLALGYVPAAPPDGFASWEAWHTHFKVPKDEWGDGAFIEDPDGIRPGISFLKVPEGKRDEPRIGFHLGTAGIQQPRSGDQGRPGGQLDLFYVERSQEHHGPCQASR
ncbi:VOC family protein [Micromonospora sp. NPDC004551]|uniref:VOC family protein n=1 Tax=Micromonospora sp. NPDC004551 TaxID=3154284 RepID=UPI0033B9CBCC